MNSRCACAMDLTSSYTRYLHTVRTIEAQGGSPHQTQSRSIRSGPRAACRLSSLAAWEDIHRLSSAVRQLHLSVARIKLLSCDRGKRVHATPDSIELGVDERLASGSLAVWKSGSLEASRSHGMVRPGTFSNPQSSHRLELTYVTRQPVLPVQSSSLCKYTDYVPGCQGASCQVLMHRLIGFGNRLPCSQSCGVGP